MHSLVAFNLIEKQVALIPFRRARLCLKYFVEPGERGFVFRFSANWPYVCHDYTSLAFIRSYSA